MDCVPLRDSRTGQEAPYEVVRGHVWSGDQGAVGQRHPHLRRPRDAPLTQTLGELRAELADPQVMARGIREGGHLVASVRVRQAAPAAAEVGRLAVAPDRQGSGLGTGVVLRGGQAYAIRWSRPDADGGTTFTTASGQPMTFARGPVWVVLAAAP